MSQVDEFHSHPWNGTTVTVPGPVRECDDPHCSEARAGIKEFARMNQEWLERQIGGYEQTIQLDLDTLSRLREAVRLKNQLPAVAE